MLYPGMTFLMPSGTYTDPNIKHLFIVCTNVDKLGNAVFVPISSWKNTLSDSTCILEVGCHPFVVRKSHVLYRKSIIEKASAIEKGLAEGIFKKKEDFQPDLLVSVLEGIKLSPSTPYKVKKYFQN